MGMSATATKLIKRFGQAAILRQTVEGEGGDPWEPPVTTEVDHAVTVAVTDYTIEQRANLAISESDLRVFMAVSDAAPVNTDTLVIGGVDYVVVSVSTLGPDGVTICHDVQVRR